MYNIYTYKTKYNNLDNDDGLGDHFCNIIYFVIHDQEIPTISSQYTLSNLLPKSIM